MPSLLSLFLFVCFGLVSFNFCFYFTGGYGVCLNCISDLVLTLVGCIRQEIFPIYFRSLFQFVGVHMFKVCPYGSLYKSLVISIYYSFFQFVGAQIFKVRPYESLDFLRVCRDFPIFPFQFYW